MASAAAPSHAAADRVIAGAGKQETPPSDDRPPAGWRLSAEEAIALASEHADVARARAGHPGSHARAYLKERRHWQVSYFDYGRSADAATREVAAVLLRDSDGAIVEAWTGFRVDWMMARGYPGAFGRTVNAPWIWLGLCAAFVLPFLRRPLRLLHLDLLALLSLSVSYALFTAGRVEGSVPLAVPPLAYLLGRMLVLAWRRAADRAPAHRPPLALALSTRALAIGVLLLVAFRLVLNITGSNVIDVGYAGVIGADRLLSGNGLYGTFPLDNPRGDTYGPVTYYAYVPWELLMPWRGHLDHLPAAHAAAATFDLAAIAVLWRLGSVVRGPRLGVLLAYAWCAFPFTLLALDTNGNAALTAALIGVVLLSLGHRLRRGGAIALAGLAKFAPLALGPLAATHPGDLRPGAFAHVRPDLPGLRRAAATAVGFAVVAAVLLLPVMLLDGLPRMLERTLAFQSGRTSPFSPWGLYDLPAAQTAVTVGAIALALVAAVLPRRRDVIVVSALAAAVLIAVQLALGHWFHSYVVWFLPPLWLALLGQYAEPARQAAGRSTDSIDSARRADPARMSTALSQGSTSEGS